MAPAAALAGTGIKAAGHNAEVQPSVGGAAGSAGGIGNAGDKMTVIGKGSEQHACDGTAQDVPGVDDPGTPLATAGTTATSAAAAVSDSDTPADFCRGIACTAGCGSSHTSNVKLDSRPGMTAMAADQLSAPQAATSEAEAAVTVAAQAMTAEELAIADASEARENTAVILAGCALAGVLANVLVEQQSEDVSLQLPGEVPAGEPCEVETPPAAGAAELPILPQTAHHTATKTPPQAGVAAAEDRSAAEAASAAGARLLLCNEDGQQPVEKESNSWQPLLAAGIASAAAPWEKEAYGQASALSLMWITADAVSPGEDLALNLDVDCKELFAFETGSLSAAGDSSSAMCQQPTLSSGSRQLILADLASWFAPGAEEKRNRELQELSHWEELNIQTVSLRSRLQRQDVVAQEAADARKQVELNEAQVSALQAQQLKLQELSQAALRESLRAAQAAEQERDRLKEQLADTTAQEAAAARDAAAAARIDELLQDKGELEKRVQQLMDERQQLLQKLFDAIEQIADLHAELGPAVLRSLTNKGRSVLSSQESESTSKLRLLELQPGSASAAGYQLSAAVGQLSSRTDNLMVATKEALEGQAEAQQQLEELQQAYRELQQHHGTLQAKHKQLSEEHSQLLNRQLEMAAERSKMRQQVLTLEEQQTSSRQQMAALQEDLSKHVAPAAAAAATSDLARPSSANAAVTAAQLQQALHQQLLMKQQLNHRLKLELSRQVEEATATAVQLQELEATAVDESVMMQLDTRNKALLQEVARLLSESAVLQKQLAAARGAVGNVGPLPAPGDATAVSPFQAFAAVDNAVMDVHFPTKTSYARSPSFSQVTQVAPPDAAAARGIVASSSGGSGRAPAIMLGLTDERLLAGTGASAGAESPTGIPAAAAGVRVSSSLESPSKAADATAAGVGGGLCSPSFAVGSPGRLLPSSPLSRMSRLRRSKSWNDGNSSLRVSWSDRSAGNQALETAAPAAVLAPTATNAGSANDVRSSSLSWLLTPAQQTLDAAAALPRPPTSRNASRSLQSPLEQLLASGADTPGNNLQTNLRRSFLQSSELDKAEHQHGEVSGVQQQQQQQRAGSHSLLLQDVQPAMKAAASGGPVAVPAAAASPSMQDLLPNKHLQSQEQQMFVDVSADGSTVRLQHSGAEEPVATAGQDSAGGRAAAVAAVLQRHKAASFASGAGGRGGGSSAGDRAKIVAAVLQRQKAQSVSGTAAEHSNQLPAAQRAALQGSSSSSGRVSVGSKLSAHSLNGRPSVSSLDGAAAAGFRVAEDRASLVAAVLAERHQRQQSQAASSEDGAAGVAASFAGGRSSSRWSSLAGGDLPVSSAGGGGGGGVKSAASTAITSARSINGGTGADPRDRASLVAAVLARQSLSAR
eukprot:gene7107-7320_t